MIKANVEYGLHGAFKADVYDARGNFVETTDWFHNFITQTGLMYPTVYSFANCFRFLSLGRQLVANKGGTGGVPTTGVLDGIYDFRVTDGSTTSTQSAMWMGYEGYETGSADGTNPSCASILESDGIRFFRSWDFPTGGQQYVIDVPEVGGNPTGLMISEFAVSPGGVNDTVGKYAFSRVPKTLYLKNGHRTVITYQLYVKCINYSLTQFTGIFNTGTATLIDQYDTELIKRWGELSGYYRQVWPGLSCVDNWGASFIPKFGNGMEPSLTNLSNYYLYFSPDNGAFDVNNVNGGNQSSTINAWSSDGVMAPVNDGNIKFTRNGPESSSETVLSGYYYGVEAPDSSIPSTSTPVNIRLGSYAGGKASLDTANISNYSVSMTNNGEYNSSNFNYQHYSGFISSGETISFATPGASGLDLSQVKKDQRAVFSSKMFRIPMDMSIPGNNAMSGRRKVISRKAIFPPSAGLGYNTRFGSLVFAYKKKSEDGQKYQDTYYPIMDCLFYDSSGYSMMQHYRYISGIYLTKRGSGVAGCSVTIHPDGDNVRKIISRRTFQGPVDGQPIPTGWVTGETWRVNNLIPGDNYTVTGSWTAFNSANASSGIGGVIGFSGDDFSNPDDPDYKFFDVGIAKHHTGSLVEPTGNDLYWPYYGQNKMIVDFHDIVFYKDENYYPDNPAYNLSASGWERPTGYLLHYDAIGGTGYRLLPNFAVGNMDTGINTYADYNVKYGGIYPGFSLNNGMELYMDITWSGGCDGALDCV